MLRGMRTIDASEALESLRHGQTLRDVTVVGPLTLGELAEDDVVRAPIRIEGCRIDHLAGESLRFAAGVVIANSSVGVLSFTFAYFPGGLDVADCAVGGGADFQCGGHNTGGRAFRLARCVFAEFVNFFDCWFEGPVVVRECRFEAGSNLLGNVGRPMQVQFDVTPVIESNVGSLDLDGG